jgi:hypothetical protein
MRLALVPVAFFLGAVTAGGAAVNPRPPVVDRMLSFEVLQTHGVVGFRSLLVSSAKTFLGAIQTRVEAGYLAVDGKLVEAKLYTVTENGKPLGGALRKRLEDGIQRDVQSPHKSPLRLADATDYSYNVASDCGGCAAGETRVHFVALVRDRYHDNGDMWVDSMSARPLRMTSAPAILPSLVTANSTTAVFASVDSHMWAVSRQTVHATIKRFFITADSNSVQSLTGYRRFPDIRLAHAALEKQLR